MFYCFIKTTLVKHSGIILTSSPCQYSNIMTASEVRGNCLAGCEGTSTFTHHCFYMFSANVNTVKKANHILVSYENSFDLMDFLVFVSHTWRLAGRNGHSHYGTAVTTFPSPRKKDKENQIKVYFSDTMEGR